MATLDNGEFPLPAGAPRYVECRPAYARCTLDEVSLPDQGSRGRRDGARCWLAMLMRECAPPALGHEEVLQLRKVKLDLLAQPAKPPRSQPNL